MSMKHENKMNLKYEFDTLEEYNEAMKHLEDYHDCEKCHGKIVYITTDGLGNTKCGYCGEIVKYPRMKKEAFEKMIKSHPKPKQNDKKKLNEQRIKK